MSVCMVYFASCSDLQYTKWTKIGCCENWVDRSRAYNTSFPICGPIPYFVIIAKEYKIVETIFLKEFKNISSKSETTTGGTEWIKKTLTMEEINDVLEKYKLDDKCTLLHGCKLDKFLEDAASKVRILEKKKQDERETESNDYIKTYCIEEEPFAYILHDYQESVVEKIKASDKCILNWTCGLGKTIVSMYIMKYHKKVLIGVPSVLLLKQWVICIKNCFPCLPILAITSSTISGIENTTCAAYVNDWIFSKKFYVIVSTYHSSSIVQNFEIDLKILDECHHLCQINDDGNFYKILQIKSKKQLSLTATMKAIDDKNKIDNFDKDSFGEIIDTKSTLWAIENKYITEYEVVTMRVEETTLSYIMSEVLGSIIHQELFMAAFVILESMSHHQDLTHIISYTNNIKNARLLNDYIDILLEKRFIGMRDGFYRKALDSESIKTTSIYEEIESFTTSRRGVISSVYIFGEGVSIPKVNGICIAENMISEIRIVQSVMRGNRLDAQNPNKINRMILPYIENEQNSFEKVETVISKMGNQDSCVETRIRACTIGFGGINSMSREYIVDFNNVKELDHVKLKLRHRTALRMGVSNVKYLYLYLKSLNAIHGIKSRHDYFTNPKVTHERLDNPQQHFDNKDPTVWRSWYDFLGVDINIYPQNKNKWRDKCNQLKITSENYSQQWESHGLPEQPDDLYRDFKTIHAELYEKRNRRRRI
jgi:superfamily II DNA or RNA helicase